MCEVLKSVVQVEGSFDPMQFAYTTGEGVANATLTCLPACTTT